MSERRPLTALLAVALSISATAFGLVIAANCDAADWQQAAMLTVLPLLAAVGAGFATSAARRMRGHRLSVALGLGVGAATWFASFLLWIATCSS
jgi:hypothetical protein